MIYYEKPGEGPFYYATEHALWYIHLDKKGGHIR